MNWNKGLTQLQDILSKLYPNRNRSQEVVRKAGLSVENIDFDGSAQTIWHNILVEADNQKGVKAIVDIAISEYGKREDELEKSLELYASQSSVDGNDLESPSTPDMADFKGCPAQRGRVAIIIFLAIPLLFFAGYILSELSEIEQPPALLPPGTSTPTETPPPIAEFTLTCADNSQVTIQSNTKDTLSQGKVVIIGTNLAVANWGASEEGALKKYGEGNGFSYAPTKLGLHTIDFTFNLGGKEIVRTLHFNIVSENVGLCQP